MEKLQTINEQFITEFEKLEHRHKDYLVLTEKINEEQSACLKAVKHVRLYLNLIRKEIGGLKKTDLIEDELKCNEIESNLKLKELSLADIQETLPRKNGFYLRIVLGNVDVSFLSKQDRFMYKSNYENFKIVISAIIATIAFLFYFFVKIRWMDSLFHFLLVWYYATLTIRERILIQNGSRIKGWWSIYHFISTAEAGIMVIWPWSDSYSAFRDQFMLFIFYLSMVRCIQYYYQVGCLYKLRALGARPSMDITVDGYMSWMSKRLSFILPFLIVTYAFQIYNAYTLYTIYRGDYCNEWQPLVVGILCLSVAIGSLFTTLLVITQKLFATHSPLELDGLRRRYSLQPYLTERSDPRKVD